MKTTKLISGFSIFIFLNLIGLNAIFANAENSLLITEIGNHETSENEWIEAFNQSDQDIIVADIILNEDNVNHKTTLFQGSNIIKPNEYFLIVNNSTKFLLKYPELVNTNYTILDSSWTSLSNNGELLKITQNNIVLTEVTYPENSTTYSLQLNQNTQDWIKGQSSSFFQAYQSPIIEEEVTYENPDSNPENEPESNSENNIEQENTEQNTDTESNDNQNTTDQPIPETIIVYEYNPYIIFSEISINSSPDWVEIFIDPRNQDLDLSKLNLVIDNKIIPSGINSKINSPSYLTLDLDLVATTEQVSIQLNDQTYDSVCWNNGAPTATETLDEINMKDSKEWFEDCLNSSNISKNQIFKRNQLLPDTNYQVDFSLSSISTKGIANNSIQNSPPIPLINLQNSNSSGYAPLSVNLDGSSSTDPESQALTYKWEINGQTYTTANPASLKFDEPGNYNALLTVTDSEGLSSKGSLLINVIEKPELKISSSTTKTTTAKKTELVSLQSNEKISIESPKTIEIYEFLPNPKGADTNAEWIKIYNYGDKTISLTNWYLDDIEGGSTPYSLKGLSIEPKQELIISNADSKISLNNSNEKVRLLYFDKIIEELEYEVAKEGVIFQKYMGTIIEFDPSNKTQSSSTSKTLSSNLQKYSTTSTINSTGQSNSELQITEVYPNPKGTDSKKEWIEIHNPSATATNLNNWKLKVNSKENSLKDLTIQPNQYLIIKDYSLPNSNAIINLIDPSNKTISSVEYEKALEGKSYSLVNKDFLWTEYLTPEKANPKSSNIRGKITNLDTTNQIITINSLQDQETYKVLATQEQITKLALKKYIEAKILQYENKNILLEINKIEEYESSENKKSPNIIFITITTLIILSLLGLGLIFQNQIKNVMIEASKYFK